jgi:two-component system response regulator TtrR
MGRHRESVFNKREMEVIALIGKGMNNEDIAEKMCISERTVQCHQKNIKKKCGLHRHPESLSSIIQSIFPERIGQ